MGQWQELPKAVLEAIGPRKKVPWHPSPALGEEEPQASLAWRSLVPLGII